MKLAILLFALAAPSAFAGEVLFCRSQNTPEAFESVSVSYNGGDDYYLEIQTSRREGANGYSVELFTDGTHTGYVTYLRGPRIRLLSQIKDDGMNPLHVLELNGRRIPLSCQAPRD